MSMSIIPGISNAESTQSGSQGTEIQPLLEPDTDRSKEPKNSSENQQPSLPPDSSMYRQSKIFGQGMMDIALLTTNVQQLRSILNQHSEYFSFVIHAIIISIVLQIAVALGLIWHSCKVHVNCKCKEHSCFDQAKRANSFTLAGIVFITVINIFISVFGVETQRLGLENIQPLSPDVNVTSSL